MESITVLTDLLKKDRSIRRFQQEKPLSRELLESLVDLTRYCASGRNLQPLKYLIVDDSRLCAEVFPLLKWAGYLTDWDGPGDGERPVAYIVQGLDTRLTKNCMCDDGLQLQTLTLGATAHGIGGCIIKAFNAPALEKVLNLPEWFVPTYVLALGFPSESVVIEDMDADSEDAVKYFRTPDGVHHVPKRSLKDILLK